MLTRAAHSRTTTDEISSRVAVIPIAVVSLYPPLTFGAAPVKLRLVAAVVKRWTLATVFEWLGGSDIASSDLLFMAADTAEGESENGE